VAKGLGSGLGVGDEHTLTYRTPGNRQFVITEPSQSVGFYSSAAGLSQTSGIGTFIAAGDTPLNYSGAEGKLLAVNSGASDVEFIAASTVVAGTSLKIDDADGDTSITTVEGYLSGSGDAIQFEVDGDNVMFLSNLGDASDGPILNLVNNDGSIVSDDVIGHIVFSGTDAGQAQYCSQIKCVSTTTHGAGTSTNASSKLEFYSRNGTTNTLGMYINYNGELWAPVVYGNGVAWGARDVYISPSGEMGYLSSIRESKANIQDLSNIDWLYNLSPVSFNYREYEKIDQTSEVDGKTETKTVKNYLDTYSSEIEYGLIAEDVALVNTDFCDYDVDSEGNKTLVGVGYKKLITPMLQALKDQKKLIEDLTARIEALEGK